MSNEDTPIQTRPVLYGTRNPHLVRLAFLAGVTLFLLIPVSMIRQLIEERQERHANAIKEVTSKWGGPQILTGPALVLPHAVRSVEKTTDGKEVVRTNTRNAVFLPKRLRTAGVITEEVRERGIFEVPVYSLSFTVDGEFERPNLAGLGIDSADVDWSKAHLAFGISDVRALRAQSSLSWNGRQIEFLPGTGGFTEAGQGLHVLMPAGFQDSAFTFTFPISLNGSESLYVVPFAEETVVQIHSNSSSPNFQGNWLPTDRTVTRDGFDAIWRVSYLGRNYPQMWDGGADVRKSIEGSQFGVELKDPIDQYRMTDRSVKYAGLFIVLTFTSIWLLEVLAKSSVHPVQYLILGAALCIFYLLELSLSEHVPFSLAYGIASLAIVAMVAAYGRTLFRNGQRGFVVPMGVALLYSYLYVLLTNEDAALLVGSIGLFAILGMIMFVTRGVNWDASVPDRSRS